MLVARRFNSADLTYDLTKLTYGNGDYITYDYDKKGRITEKGYSDSTGKTTYAYDNNDNLGAVTDGLTGRTTKYFYDHSERLVQTEERGTGYDHTLKWTYDENNNLTRMYEKMGSAYYNTYYTYDKDNRPTLIRNGSPRAAYTYDSLGRLSTLKYKYVDADIITHTPTYTAKSGDATRTSTQIASWRIKSGSSYDKTVGYTYDGNGNITKVTFGGKSTTYVYDGLGQLTRENNQAAGKTWTYTYDAGGNIVEKKEYAYTTGALGTATDTIAYGYTDSSWGDLLTSYDGKTITSDTIGNILSDGTRTYTWKNGRQLASAVKGTTTATFTYNNDGLRSSKTSGGKTWQYYYNGDQLTRMKNSTDTLQFIHDTTGVLVTKYNGTYYYYLKNPQGDVIALADVDGNVVVEYTYDAWGKPLSVTGSMASTLGALNPIRYRGYYYDTETGLYYLQSRYYDPEMGRFISADGYVSTGTGILGNNMFAYCGNNPVNRVDYTGRFWSEIWEFAKTAVTEIGKAMGLISPAYAGCGGATIVDGPLPIGDIVAAVGATLLTIGAIGYGIYQATQAPAISIPKVEEKSEAIVIPKEPDSPVIFPVDPNTFNPAGLVKVPRAGTKNGAFISWMDPLTNTEVFRWDENLNYSNGPHYHIHGTGHYYPETIVPEPYATIYFPFR